MITKIDMEAGKVYTKGGAECANCHKELPNNSFAYLCDGNGNLKHQHLVFCDDCQFNPTYCVSYHVCLCSRISRTGESVHYAITIVELKDEEAIK
jgi:hypothetical protein